MTSPHENHIDDILTELYTLDPGLREFSADLPKLISALKANQPEVIINSRFAAELRDALLKKSVSEKTTPASPIPSPYLWWFSRIAPVGIAVGIIVITLIPQRTHPPIQEFTPAVPSEASPEAAPSEMRMKTFDANESSDAMLFQAAPFSEALPLPLEVFPPTVGDILTITSLTAPVDGWLVVYTDTGLGKNELIASTIVPAGAQEDLQLKLSRPLRYPEMVTVTLYTSTNQEQFIETAEEIQLDPESGLAITVSVPVISELEMNQTEAGDPSLP